MIEHSVLFQEASKKFATQIRHSLSDSAATMFLHSMNLSHIDYCLISWSLTCTTPLKSIESLFKKKLKILDKMAFSLHTCNIMKKNNAIFKVPQFLLHAFFSNVFCLYCFFISAWPNVWPYISYVRIYMCIRAFV